MFPIGTLPQELQTLINKFNKRSNIKDLRLLIQKLCAWQALTAQQLVKNLFLNSGGQIYASISG